MKDLLRYGFLLALICSIASGLLASVNSLTKEKILSQAKAQEEASLKEVLPLGAIFKPIKSGNDIIYYKAYNKDDQFIGIAFKASGKGYSGPIETMGGMTKDGAITAIKILSQNETPGLGNRITEPSFIGQFSNKNIQGLNGVQAITGATISSKAIIDSVKIKAETIRPLIKDGK